MPVQCLIRHLSRAQVDKAIADASMQERLVVEDHDGELLIVIVGSNEVRDPEANVMLQKIANADAALTQKAQAALAAAEKAATKPKP